MSDHHVTDRNLGKLTNQNERLFFVATRMQHKSKSSTTMLLLLKRI